VTGSEAATTGAVVFGSPDDLIPAVGGNLGTTPWVTLEASDVSRFVEATGSPVNDGEVPPLMVLSLTNRFLPDLLRVEGVSSGVNYGAGSARFPFPVQPGHRIRASARLSQAAEVPGGVQTTVEITVEVEGSGEPACVVESLSRWMR
jgi:hypothetical protein